MSIQLLFDYLQLTNRYKGGKKEFELLAKEFNLGVRNFLGVQVNENGFPLWDNQEPEKGYMNNYLSTNLKFGETKNITKKRDIKLFIPTKEDYNYFMGFYGRGGVISNPELFKVSFAEFEWACLNFQKYSEKVWWEFGSIEREMARDQLLHEFGDDPIGYIFSPYHRYAGIEHLQFLRKQ
jgi:hypothetical protein